METISIVYHSDAGHTLDLAKKIADGIESITGNLPKLISVDEIDMHWDYLHQSDTIIFGCPTYMGNVSGSFKSFMDKTASFWTDRKWQDKLAGGFTNSGALSGDKLGTLTAISLFAAQHGMIWVGPSEICSSFTPDTGHINRLGSHLGLMSQSNPYETPDKSMSSGDLMTAHLFGKRIAEKTRVIKYGNATSKSVCMT